jgi:hypothetical protein
MHSVLSSLTAAVLFIHTVFGCCWHHAHACVQHGAPSVATESACCKHHQHHGEGNQPVKPGKCCVECEGTCTYVLPQKVRIDAPQSVASLDLVATFPLLADAQIASASWSHVGDCPHGALPRVRLHLLHQLLLN